MDSTSTEIIELGTKAYPYKNIGLPFVEILNYHAHSDHNVTVKVKEFTENQMLYQRNYIVNMTQVIVETYSESGIGTPGYANITVMNKNVRLLSQKSVFNIMKHTTLLLNDSLGKDVVAGVISAAEQIQSEYHDMRVEYMH